MNKVFCTTAPYEVGAELFISDKTANVHVSRILIELSGSNRAAAAAHHLGLAPAQTASAVLARLPAPTPAGIPTWRGRAYMRHSHQRQPREPSCRRLNHTSKRSPRGLRPKIRHLADGSGAAYA